MKHGRVESKRRWRNLMSYLTFQNVFLMILFAAGLLINVASTQFNRLDEAEEASTRDQFRYLDAKDQDDAVSLEFSLGVALSQLQWLGSGPLNHADAQEKAELQKRIATIKILQAELRAKNDAAARSQSGSCFTADMRVLTINGATPIAEVKVGDKVLSLDAAGNRVAADVLKTFAAQENHYFLVNHRIKVTSLHRFSTDRGWKRACDLKIGDRRWTPLFGQPDGWAKL